MLARRGSFPWEWGDGWGRGGAGQVELEIPLRVGRRVGRGGPSQPTLPSPLSVILRGLLVSLKVQPRVAVQTFIPIVGLTKLSSY